MGARARPSMAGAQPLLGPARMPAEKDSVSDPGYLPCPPCREAREPHRVGLRPICDGELPDPTLLGTPPLSHGDALAHHPPQSRHTCQKLRPRCRADKASCGDD